MQSLPRVLAGLVAALLLLPPSPTLSDLRTAHDSSTMLRGCGSCHVGHGRARSTMLPAVEENLCYRCHSSAAQRSVLERKGLLKVAAPLRDVSADFRKPFHHPVERGGIHQRGEQLPERSPRKPRHVECIDCHRAHGTVRNRQSGRLARFTRRSSLDGISSEYELCYRCHSDSLNLPRNSSNIKQRFQLTNRSFHPVESVGKGRYVPSLRPPLTVNSMISCGDCHGNDTGRGIHGSRYRFLLRKHYSTSGRTPESPFAYALCYSCHDRNKLYSGVGFPYHQRHVKQGRIPCSECHNAHGSAGLPHLFEFPQSASSSRTSGQMAYMSLGAGNGICYVRCHGVEHEGKQYCDPTRGCTNVDSSTAPVRKTPLNRQFRDSPFSF